MNQYEMQIIKSLLIILIIFFSCSQKATNKSLNNENESDWLGKYYLYLEGGNMDGINIGWNYNLNIGIDSITFEQDGYKLYKHTLIKVRSYSNDSIEFDYGYNLEGSDISNPSSPLLTLYNKNGKYYIKGISNLEAVTPPHDINCYEIIKIDSVLKIEINETNLSDLLSDIKNEYITSGFISDAYGLNYNKFLLRIFEFNNTYFKLNELIYLEDDLKITKSPKNYNRFLIITNNYNTITDTIQLIKGMDYSFDIITDQTDQFSAFLAIGYYYEDEEFFEIHDLFGLNDNGGLSKIKDSIQIFDNPAPLDYWSDDDTGKYKFGFKNEKRYSRFWNEEL